MTDMQKNEVNALRQKGLSPTEIASQLGLTANTIRIYISRNPEIKGLKGCKNCGKAINLGSGRYVFCSDKCKQAWFNSERGKSRGSLRKCKNCGKEFKGYGSTQYCCRECYLNNVQKPVKKS